MDKKLPLRRKESLLKYHNLWDVIVNGDLEEEAAPSGEESAPPTPKTVKQLAAKRNQERVKSILLLAIPDEHLLKFHNVPDAKSLWAVFKSRFGGAIYRIELEEYVRKKDFEHALRASADFTTFQNLRAQVTELRSENDDLKLSVKELTKEREHVEVTLRQRDELVLTHENDDLKLSVKELTKERELVEVTLRQRDEMVLTHSTFETKNLELVKEIGDKVKCFDEEKKAFETKISKLENVLSQQSKGSDDVKIELLKRTDKYDTYFANLEKRNAFVESELASQNYTSLQKENNDLRTSYNVLKQKFDSLNQENKEHQVSKRIEKYETYCEELEKENDDLRMQYKRLFDSTEKGLEKPIHIIKDRNKKEGRNYSDTSQFGYFDVIDMLPMLVHLIISMFNKIHDMHKEYVNEGRTDLLLKDVGTDILHNKTTSPKTWLQFNNREYSRESKKTYWDAYKGLMKKEIEGPETLSFVDYGNIQNGGPLQEIQEPMIRKYVLEFISTIRFRDHVVDLDVNDTLVFQLGGIVRRMKMRQFSLELGLYSAEEMNNNLFAFYHAALDRMERITIKEYKLESEFNLLKIDLDLFTYDTPLALILIDNRLVKLMDITLEQWLKLKIRDHKKVDNEIVEGVVGTWLIQSYKKQFEEYMEIKRQLEVCGINTDVECDLINKDFTKWIETDIFDFETPLCKEFKDFNHILQIDVDVLTGDLPGFKTYEDYKNAWIYEWNKEVSLVEEKPWLDDRTWKEPNDDICDECKSKKLKKAILEGSWGYENRKGKNFCSWLKESFGNYHELDYELMLKLEEYWRGKKDEKESSDDAWSNHLPNNELEHFERVNNDAIQANQERFNIHEPMDDDDDIEDIND
ncbi:hypothetical protein Tco_0377979 [Tanacetum coccineum]